MICFSGKDGRFFSCSVVALRVDRCAYISLFAVAGEVGESREESVRGLDHPLVVELFLGGGADGVVVRDEVGEDLNQLVEDILRHVGHDVLYDCFLRGSVSVWECGSECGKKNDMWNYAG